MTHDELLAKVTHGYRWTCDRDREPWDALRAVVELHKPRAYKNKTDEMYIKGWNAAMDKVIQAIEKELNGY